jgi:hypothetical protein
MSDEQESGTAGPGETLAEGLKGKAKEVAGSMVQK